MESLYAPVDVGDLAGHVDFQPVFPDPPYTDDEQDTRIKGKTMRDRTADVPAAHVNLEDAAR